MDLSNYSQVQTLPNPEKGDQPESGLSANSNSDASKAQKDSLGVNVKPGTGAAKSPDPKRLQKTGSSAEEGSTSISKSHSSSANSLDDQAVSSEGVCSANFVDSFPIKNDFALNACLYIGTSLGSIIVITINLPERGDPRLNEPVVVR